MPLPAIGKPAPLFETTDEQGNAIKLADFKGKCAIALIFYPKDDTPG